MSYRRIRLTTALAAAVLMLTSNLAIAGGFEYTENGARILSRSGAWGAKADDPMAIHYNPAGLANWRGHKILINGGITYFDSSLTMLGVDEFVGEGKRWDSPTVSNSAPPFFAPALAWGYGGDGWGVGLAVYGPSAYGARDYGKDGPQQFMLGYSDLLLAYVSAGFAARPIPELSIGFTFQWVTMPYATFGLTIDGAAVDSPQAYANCSGDDCGPDAYHAATELNVSDWANFAAIVGIHWAPTPFLEFGLSSRVTPIELKGTGPADINFLSASTASLFDPGEEEFATAHFVDKACGSAADPEKFDATQPGCKPNSNVSLNLVLPPWVRLAARYIHRDAKEREIFDIELDVVVEFWSMLNAYDIEFEGQLKFFNNLKELKPFSLPKKYKDVVSVRLGSDIAVVPDLFTLHLGAHWESETSPEAYTNIDFLGLMRVGASIGFTIKPIKELEITLAYQLIRQPGRVVSPEQAGVPIQRPISDTTEPDGWDSATQGEYQGLPANAAIYHPSTYHTGALSVVVHID